MRKAPRLRGLLSAPKRTRTSTRESPDKALTLVCWWFAFSALSVEPVVIGLFGGSGGTVALRNRGDASYRPSHGLAYQTRFPDIDPDYAGRLIVVPRCGLLLRSCSITPRRLTARGLRTIASRRTGAGSSLKPENSSARSARDERGAVAHRSLGHTNVASSPTSLRNTARPPPLARSCDRAVRRWCPGPAP
jgi:hypothetical protein